jgi:peptidoglycan/LPS O-acetylase OafA/YrhL
MRSLAATVVAVAAAAFGVLTARNCDAPDWRQGVMLLAVPLIAGAGVGVAVWTSRDDREWLGIGLALLAAVGTEIGVVALWIGECSK